MGIWDLVILAVGLAMDAFAVSICKGLSAKKASLKEMAICGGWFGSFQAIMPLLGFLLGGLFASAIEKFDHWVAFVLLLILGVNMLKEGFLKGKGECDDCEDFSFKTMFVMAIATSIDALAVGISLAMAGNVNIVIAIILIGVITFLLSALGVKIGQIFGAKLQNVAQVLGGFILIFIGVKILFEHLAII